MYHRQALKYIYNNEPLTEAMLDIYSSYLGCKYVANRTKLTVLSDLGYRALLDVEKTRSISNSPVFLELPQLLESPNAHIRRESVEFIRKLADHRPESLLVPVRVDSLNQIAEKLETLICDGDKTLVESVMGVLVQIALWSLYNRAQGYISDAAPLTDETVLNICSSYLHSEHAAGIKLVVLWRLRSRMATVEIGAQSIVSSSIFREILQLLDSSDFDIRLETVMLITELTSHHSVVASPTNVLNQVVEKLELALHDESMVVGRALDSLTNIAFWLPGAECIVACGVLAYTQELLASTSTHPRLAIGAARLIGTIAEHHSDEAAIVASMIQKLNSFEKIVILLQHNDTDVVSEGLFCLRRMARPTLGVQLIMDAAEVEHIVVELLDSSDFWVRLDTCGLIAELASNEIALSKLLAADLLPEIVKLLRRWDEPELKVEALAALCQIARWKLGADAICENAAALEYVVIDGLDSPNTDVQSKSCRLIEGLSSHETVLSQVLSAGPLPKIVQLLRGEIEIEALAVFCQISSWKLGAEAILNTPDALDIISKIKFEYWDSQMWEPHAKLLQNLAKHRRELDQELTIDKMLLGNGGQLAADGP
ncbi:armadillo-type protein [Roridomyces roridus]|uniref:Vacuolar protein 8 n=1 Tax=Roridomyces roridus TaxID=1738132 RepID=A0AAD7AYH4_9AGAR|nr:armadillo-type protein [Roridomyces roridus]